MSEHGEYLANATPLETDMAADILSSSQEAASQVRSGATDLGHSAADKIDEQRGAAASGIDSAARSLHGRAEDLARGGQRAAGFAHGAAAKMNVAADYIREHDLSAIFEDVKSIVKRNPAASMTGAAVLGFILAKAFSRRD